MAAAVSETARTSFNPSWMGSTYAGGSGAPGLVSRSASANDAGPAPLGTIHHGDANSNNAPMAPPKLSKGYQFAAYPLPRPELSPHFSADDLAQNRYGREDLLALQPSETTPPPYMKEKFPEFYIHERQQPVCLSTFSDTEERLLMQGGINSSKVMSAISHAERPGFDPPRPGFHPRWSQDGGPPGPGNGPPGGPFNGRGGFGGPPGRGGFGGGFNPYQGRGRGAGPMGGPSGGHMGGPPGMENNRFGGLGRGRGGPVMGGRGGGTTGAGGQDRGGGAFNPRAQGLYDPKDPRDRPRQRVKSVGESTVLGGPGGGPYGGPGGAPGMGRGRGPWEGGRNQDGEPIPAWMDSDEGAIH